MQKYDQKLTEILGLLSGSWKVADYQPAGMGWAAVLADGTHVMTLHSERGWVDVYRGRFTEQEVLGCKQHAIEIADLISSHAN
ncbi:hypothetical protein [uncultured Marinobacter sp.]|uniref:hypothetical protein n=1 Tax=uncultured Marinobacter sp. TaxID=187379 RepID=UPI002588C141|nr:hypothetical protein [uncultured Marinobacter sp.]